MNIIFHLSLKSIPLLHSHCYHLLQFRHLLLLTGQTKTTMETICFKSVPFQSIYQAAAGIIFLKCKACHVPFLLKNLLLLCKGLSLNPCLWHVKFYGMWFMLWALFFNYTLPPLSWTPCIPQLQIHHAISDLCAFAQNAFLCKPPTNPIAQLIIALLTNKLGNVW